jgi:hypothetical protein
VAIADNYCEGLFYIVIGGDGITAKRSSELREATAR